MWGGLTGVLVRRIAVAVIIVFAPIGAVAASDLEPGLTGWADSLAWRLPAAHFTEGEVEGCGPVWHLDDPNGEQLSRLSTGPMVMDHGRPTDDVVILFHGLSDSPFFLCAIARQFFDQGANVVLPLLTGHGRAEPMPEAHAPDLAEHWKDDALAALDFAETRGSRVSAGGLSTGGLLSVWLWTEAPERLDGGLFLFSAAFDFAFVLKMAAACTGTAEEDRSGFQAWCRSVLVEVAQSGERDIAWRKRNPYRNHFSLYGALELGLLRRATLSRLNGVTFDPPLFIAHSDHDTTAPVAGLEALADRHVMSEHLCQFPLDHVHPSNCAELASDCVTPRKTADQCGIPHASVVLAEPIHPDGAADGPICETANPKFEPMMAAATTFFQTWSATACPAAE